MTSPYKRKLSENIIKRKFSDGFVFENESKFNQLCKYYYLALFQRIKNRTLNNLQKSITKKKKENKEKNENKNYTSFTGFHSMPKIVNNLLKYEIKEKVDNLVNIISEKYQDEGYFYIPQFCTILKENNYTESLENYLLDQCSNKMKFSLYVYWIISSYTKQQKLKKFLETIEMCLVNGLNINYSNYKDIKKSKTDIEIFQENISKEFRVNYYNICIKFYQNLKSLCEKLKDYPINERKNILNSFLNNQNKKIIQLIKNEDIDETSKLIKGLYRGYILPFNDNKKILDEESYIIVKFNNLYSRCFNTKARVPCKITFEVVKVKDLENWDDYILEEIYFQEGRARQSTFYINEISLKEKNIKNKKEEKIKINEIKETKEISLKEFLYTEIKEDDIIDNEIKEENKNNNNNELIKLGEIRSLSTGEPHYFFNNYNLINMENKYGNPFGEKWFEMAQKIKQKSSFRNFPSHTIKSFIAKSDDDLRQESLTMQLIKMMSDIFQSANLNLQLRTYEIIITSRTSGLIELIPDSISIDDLKKKTGTDLNTFYRNFFSYHFKEAQKNFAESLAAYSIVTYILNLKDRHNGNIMIDIQGRIIHIDFGFILGISPGNVGFESAPFKMTKEYIILLDGINSEIYKYFISILTKGFLEIRKYFDSFVKIIDIMTKNSDMPCFIGRDPNLVIRDFISRFHLEKSEKEIEELIINLVKDSIDSWRTYQYDIYQKITNGIKP